MSVPLSDFPSAMNNLSGNVCEYLENFPGKFVPITSTNKLKNVRFTTIYVSLSVRLLLFTNKTTCLPTKVFSLNVRFEEMPRKLCNH